LQAIGLVSVGSFFGRVPSFGDRAGNVDVQAQFQSEKLCREDPDACPNVEARSSSGSDHNFARQLWSRTGRLELRLQVGVILADELANHAAAAIDASYWMTHRLSLGVQLTAFHPFGGVGGDPARFPASSRPAVELAKMDASLGLESRLAVLEGALPWLENPAQFAFYGLVAAGGFRVRQLAFGSSVPATTDYEWRPGAEWGVGFGLYGFDRLAVNVEWKAQYIPSDDETGKKAIWGNVVLIGVSTLGPWWYSTRVPK
jgi:hypothetical protein